MTRKQTFTQTILLKNKINFHLLFLLTFLVLPASLLFASEMKRGNKVETAKELEIYKGVNSASMIAEEKSRTAFLLWARKVKQFFRDGVDGTSPDEQVILCNATADYLYSKFTPTRVNYEKDSRPFLEKIVTQVTAELTSDKERVLALMRFVRDLEPNPQRKDLFVGGTEEDIIKKRAWVCNEKARALIILWQVAGFPARFVGHHIGGHAATEVYFNNKWAYVDVRGLYFIKKDGQFANTWEIWNNPSLIMSQKPEIYLEMPPGYNIDNTKNMYFHPSEVIGINNYFVSKAGSYDYSWQIDPDWVEKSGYMRIQKDYRKVRAEIFGLEE